MTHPLRFGTAYFRPDPHQYIEWLKVVDEVGFDLVGYGDSQSLWPELYVSLTLAALNLRTARIGSMVTNPLTRHPAVAASGISTIQSLSRGRAFFGIATGDSAVYNIGLRASSRDTLTTYATAVRDLTAGKKVHYDGADLQIHFPTTQVPLFLAAEGPKMLHLAGQIADGVFVGNGLSRDVVQDTIARVHAGAASVGRDPDQIEIWWLVKMYVAHSVAAAKEQTLFTLASSANHALRFDFEGKFVPENLHEPIRELQRRYNFAEHAMVGGQDNARLVAELGLTDWLAERFTVLGPPDTCIERLREMHSYGVSNVMLTQLVPDPLAEMRMWARDIFPAFR